MQVQTSEQTFFNFLILGKSTGVNLINKFQSRIILAICYKRSLSPTADVSRWPWSTNRFGERCDDDEFLQDVAGGRMGRHCAKIFTQSRHEPVPYRGTVKTVFNGKGDEAINKYQSRCNYCTLK